MTFILTLSALYAIAPAAKMNFDSEKCLILMFILLLVISRYICSALIAFAALFNTCENLSSLLNLSANETENA